MANEFKIKNGLTVTGDATVSGNAGVGTTTPTNKLHIVSNAYNTGNNSTATLKVVADTSTVKYPTIMEIAASTGGNMTFAGGSSLGFVPSITFTSTLAGIGGSFIGITPTDSQFLGGTGVFNIDGRLSGGPLSVANIFSVGSFGNIKMVIAASGNVGIGTTSPSTLLEISNATSNGDSGLLKVTGTGATTNANFALQTLGGTGLYQLDYAGNMVFRSQQGGLFFDNNGTGNINFRTTSGQISRMIVLNNGNVGIGTTTPSALLTVEKSGIGVTSTDGLLLQNTTAAASGAQQYSPRLHFTSNGWSTTSSASQATDWIIENQTIQGTTSPSNILVFSNQINGGGYVTNAVFSNSGNFRGLLLPTTNNNGLALTQTGVVAGLNATIGFTGTAGGVNSVTLTADAFFSRGGVATIQLGASSAASPISQTLSVQGSRGGTDTDVAGGNLTIQSGLGTGAAIGSTITFNTPATTTTGTTAQVATARMTILGNGNVGIGTTSPSTKLYVYNASNNTIVFEAGSTYAEFGLKSPSGVWYQGTGFSGAGANSNYYLQAPGGAVVKVVTSSGNVGIGTTTPTYRLDVQGTAATDAIRSFSGFDIYPVPDPATTPTTAVVAGTALGIGNYYYGVTFVTALGETHLITNGVAVVTTSGNQAINLSSIPVSTDSRVTSRRIYRSTVNGQYYNIFLVATIADNTTTTYSDTTPDASLGTLNAYFRVNTTTNNITVGGTKAMSLDTNNVAFGPNAALSLTVGGRITAIGSDAGRNNTTGVENVFLGFSAASGVTTGIANTYIGVYTAQAVGSSGIYNVGVGRTALYKVTSGSQNTALGTFSMYENTTAGNNTAVGFEASYSNQTATNIVAVGYQALRANTAASNTAIGYQAGLANTTGANNIFIGYQATGVGITDSNRTWIGNSSTTSTWLAGNVLIGTTTDAGYKLDVAGTGRMQGSLDVVGLGTQASPSIINIYGVNNTTAGDAKLVLSQISGGNDLMLLVAGTDTRSDGLTSNDQYVMAGQRLNLMSRGNGSTHNTRIIIGDGSTSAYANIKFQTATQNSAPADRMLIDHLGNVGIGTSTPAYPLDVVGTIRTSVQGAAIGNVGNGITVIRTGGDDSQIYMGFRTTPDSWVIGASYATTGAYKPITFATSDTARMIILANGNVGVGTNSPSTKLHVKDTTNTIVNAEAGSSTYAGILQTVGSNTWRLIAQGSGASGRLDIKDESYGVTAMSFPVNSGNVGIGTTSPTALLTLVAPATGGTNAPLRITSDTGGGPDAIYFTNAGSLIRWSNGSFFSNTGMYSGVADQEYKTYDGATVQTRIFIKASTGNVGIGTTSPTYKVDVQGTTTTSGISTDIGLNLNPVTNPSTGSVSLVASAGNVDLGIHYYWVSYTTAIGETGTYNIGNVTTVSGSQQVLLTIPVSSDYRVTGRKLHRSKANGNSYETYVITTIADNTTTTYTDNIADSALTGVMSAGYYQINTTNQGISVSASNVMRIDRFATHFGINAGGSLNGGGNNTLIGYNAGRSISTGNQNVGVGTVLGALTTGGDNVAMGPSAAASITIGSANIMIGRNAAANMNGNSNQNTIVGGYGWNAGTPSAKGANTGLGYLVGSTNTGSNNLFLGYTAGYYVTGSNQILLDTLTRADEATSKSSALIYGVTNATASSQILSLGGGGNVGIGTITPTTLLDVGTTISGIIRASGRIQVGSAASTSAGTYSGVPQFFAGNNTNDTGIRFFATSTDAVMSATYFTTGSYIPIEFFTSDIERLRIAVNGNIGIGTTSPAYKVDVQGTTLATSSVSVQGAFNIARVAAPTGTITLTPSAGGSVDVGQHYYFVSFTTAIGETSIGSNTAITIVSGSQTVTITGIPTSTDPRVTGRKIYRTRAGQTSDRGMVIATIADNTTTSYVDTAADSTFPSLGDWGSYRDNTTSRQITIDGTKAMALGTGVTAIGLGAGASVTTAGLTTLVGYNAGNALTYGFQNTLVGTLAGRFVTTGNGNTVLGSYAFMSATTGGDNISIGQGSSFSNVTGFYNIAVGSGALSGQSGASHSSNIAIGTSALCNLGAANNNVAIGHFSGRYISSGAVNTLISNSILIGYDTRPNADNETNQIVIGYSQSGLGSNTTILGNSSTTFTSIPAGNLTVGGTTNSNYKVDAVGADSRFNGIRAGLGAGQVNNNTVFGNGALATNSTGDGIVAIGFEALKLATVPGNTAVGYQALVANTTAAFNTALGYQSLSAVSVGGQNTAVGYQALNGVLGGGSNTAIGYQAGLTGNVSSNTLIGASSSNGGFSASIVIGRAATATAANQFVVGSTSYNAGAVATETNTTISSWAVKINGTDRKLLLLDTAQNVIDVKQAVAASTVTTTIDWISGNLADITLTSNTLFTLSNPVIGTYIVKLTQGGGGGFIATFPLTVKWSGGVAPVLTPTAGKTDIITLVWDGTSYYGSYALNF